MIFTWWVMKWVKQSHRLRHHCALNDTPDFQVILNTTYYT